MILEDVPSDKSNKVLIKCDFNISQKCKGEYRKVYRNVLKCKANNDGKDICQYCFNTLTKTGEDNYNFKYAKNENFFQYIDSELKSYLLGWVAGDGCIKKDGLYLSVHEGDREILDLFCNTISPNYKPFFREYDNTFNIIINSVKIVNDLCYHLSVGIGKKSHVITLPNLRDELLVHFIRGLFDSDGSIANPSKTSRPVCNYSSMSEKIRDQVFRYCQDKNIKSCTSNTMVHWWGTHAVRFMYLIYNESNYYLKRKYDLYREWSTWVPFYGTRNFPRKKRKKSLCKK